MPDIQVDDDVYGCVLALVSSETNTPNLVVRRLLEMHGNLRPNLTKNDGKQLPDAPWRNRRGSSPSQTVYKNHLLYVLGTKFGGIASRLPAIEAALDLMQQKGLLPPSASEVLASNGQTKAESAMAWGRNALKDAGLIKADSPRGLWELTNEGLELSKNPMLLAQ